MKRNILTENMRRFSTKNLAEHQHVTDSDSNNNGYPDSTENISAGRKLFMDVQDFNKKEYPHIHSWDETIDYNDMLSFAKDYARYVATKAAQEFTDTDIPQQAIDEFLSQFKI